MSNTSFGDNLIPVTDLVQNLGFTSKKERFNNNFLKVQYVPLKDLFVDEEYQRLLNVSTIKKAKHFDPILCRPLFVAERPDGKLAIVDGQHTASIQAVYCGENEEDLVLPCNIYRHVEYGNETIEDCIRAEADIFNKLNTNRRNVSRVERVRAGIAAGDADSIHIDSQLKQLQINVERIGDPTGYSVKGFAKVMESIATYKLDNTHSAVKHLKELHLNEKKWERDYIDGTMIGGLAAVFHLINTELGNGAKAEGLYIYLNNYMKNTSPKDFVEKTAGLSSSVLIARRIVAKYNTLVENGVISEGLQIGEILMSKAGLQDPSKIN